MNVTVSIPEEVYDWFQQEAERRGLESVECVIQELQQAEVHRLRHEAIERIRTLQEEMRAKYGIMEESVELIREDRAR